MTRVDTNSSFVNNVPAAPVQKVFFTYFEGIGDINGDGRLDPLDSLLILKNTVGTCRLNEEQKRRADVDGNNVVDSMDALGILKIAVGLAEVR